jgi:hypothetical protein
MAPRPAPPEPTNGPTPLGATIRVSGRACAPVELARVGRVKVRPVEPPASRLACWVHGGS